MIPSKLEIRKVENSEMTLKSKIWKLWTTNSRERDFERALRGTFEMYKSILVQNGPCYFHGRHFSP